MLKNLTIEQCKTPLNLYISLKAFYEKPPEILTCLFVKKQMLLTLPQVKNI